MNLMLLSILAPVATGMLMLAVPRKARFAKEAIVLFGAAVNLAIAVALFRQNTTYTIPWFGFGFEFSNL